MGTGPANSITMTTNHHNVDDALYAFKIFEKAAMRGAFLAKARVVVPYSPLLKNSTIHILS
jgi:hypothetical protein